MIRIAVAVFKIEFDTFRAAYRNTGNHGLGCVGAGSAYRSVAIFTG